MFTGCAWNELVIPQVQEYAVKHGLNEAMTGVCLDAIDKKNCPVDMEQKDFGVPYTQGFATVRACYGFIDLNSSLATGYHDGRVCYVKDFIEQYVKESK
jgi:hypothetical protein